MPDEENRSLAFHVPRIRNMKRVRSLADLSSRPIDEFDIVGVSRQGCRSSIRT